VFVVLGAAIALSAAPVVVRSDPPTGSAEVPSGVREIAIVFDQPMAQTSWSMVGGGKHFPKDAGPFGWTDDRTFVWPVRLRPDWDYEVSFNHPCYSGFRSAECEAAVPFDLVFSTQTPPGGEPRRASGRALQRLRAAFDGNDAHRDGAGVDWNQRFTAYAGELETAASAQSFARTAAELFSVAPDAHRWLTARGWAYRTNPREVVAANYDVDRLHSEVAHWTDRLGATVSTGLLGDRVVYLRISELSGRPGAMVDALRDVIATNPWGLVIDVRENVGGDEALAQRLAGCFVRDVTAYARSRVREKGRWLDEEQRTVAPTDGCAFAATRTVVLQGPMVASSAESFLLMMRAAGATLVGDRSAGSSGRPVRFGLRNGVHAWLPSWVDSDLNGVPIEGKGVTPDVTVTYIAGAKDPVIASALVVLAETR
jgi:hypothetical protein